MWSSHHKVVVVLLALLFVGLGESEASRFSREFIEVLTLGDSSTESEEINFTPKRFLIPLRSSRRVIRLGPSSCETESERFDPITQTCYKVGTRGPCGTLMIFTGHDHQHHQYYLNPEDTKVYGHCECDRARFDRPMASVRGQCHFLYSQAICDPGHFLVIDFTKYGYEPVCRLNPCASSSHTNNKQQKNGVELLPFEGHCVKLNAPSLLCPHSQDVISFRKGALEPVCTSRTTTPTPSTNRRLFRRQITRTNELKCQEGYGRLKAGSTRCYRLLKGFGR